MERPAKMERKKTTMYRASVEETPERATSTKGSRKMSDASAKTLSFNSSTTRHGHAWVMRCRPGSQLELTHYYVVDFSQIADCYASIESQ